MCWIWEATEAPTSMVAEKKDGIIECFLTGETLADRENLTSQGIKISRKLQVHSDKE